MAITYFGSASTPADNGSQAAPTVTVTPPASMQLGDLVVMVSQQRVVATGPLMSVSQAGGQSWNTLSQIEVVAANIAYRIFWCRFNGTWTADPSVGASGTVAMSVVMHVFRPTSTDMLWAIDVALVQDAFAAPQIDDPLVYLTGVTTSHASSVALALWAVAVARPWNNVGGTGWSAFTNAQYRNTSGGQQTLTFARKIMTSAGATGDVSMGQDGSPFHSGRYGILAWYEEAPASGQPTMRRRGGVPGLVPGAQRIGRGW